jgi:ssDNA thymidine ADP-ribosyltransferase, DarT
MGGETMLHDHRLEGSLSHKGPQDPSDLGFHAAEDSSVRLLRAGTRHKPVSQESTIATPPRRLLYHFTHVPNLPSIVGRGALLSDTHVSSEGRLRVEVGDRNVKARRRSMVVPVGPGGAPADYVPFYFAARSPMLYVIARGRVPEYQDGQSPLVYLVTDIETIVRMRLPNVFSDGNCASAFTEYFDSLDRLDMVDWLYERKVLE